MGTPLIFDGAEAIESEVNEFIQAKILHLASGVTSVAHYTSLDSLFSIIDSNTIWMASIDKMNDKQEFIKGAALARDCFLRSIEAVFGHEESWLSAQIIERFDRQCKEIHMNLYCTSLSRYDPNAELSESLELWERYGDRANGVCLVFGADRLMLRQPYRDPIFWLPMCYSNEKEFVSDFEPLFDSILSYGFNSEGDDEATVDRVAGALVVYALMHKHVAFRGEKEFRLLHSPSIHPQASRFVNIENKRVRGENRNVAIVDTNKYVSSNGVGIKFQDTIEQIILGPKNIDRDVVLRMRHFLDERGLVHVPIRCSEIPYR